MYQDGAWFCSRDSHRPGGGHVAGRIAHNSHVRATGGKRRRMDLVTATTIGVATAALWTMSLQALALKRKRN